MLNRNFLEIYQEVLKEAGVEEKSGSIMEFQAFEELARESVKIKLDVVDAEEEKDLSFQLNLVSTAERPEVRELLNLDAHFKLVLLKELYAKKSQELKQHEQDEKMFYGQIDNHCKVIREFDGQIFELRHLIELTKDKTVKQFLHGNIASVAAKMQSEQSLKNQASDSLVNAKQAIEVLQRQLPIIQESINMEERQVIALLSERERYRSAELEQQKLAALNKIYNALQLDYKQSSAAQFKSFEPVRKLASEDGKSVAARALHMLQNLKPESKESKNENPYINLESNKEYRELLEYKLFRHFYAFIDKNEFFGLNHPPESLAAARSKAAEEEAKEAGKSKTKTARAVAWLDEYIGSQKSLLDLNQITAFEVEKWKKKTVQPNKLFSHNNKPSGGPSAGNGSVNGKQAGAGRLSL